MIILMYKEIRFLCTSVKILLTTDKLQIAAGMVLRYFTALPTLDAIEESNQLVHVFRMSAEILFYIVNRIAAFLIMDKEYTRISEKVFCQISLLIWNSFIG